MEILNKYIYDPKTDLLGKGGFATVYKAYDKVLDIPVALKFFQPQDQSGKYTIINEIRRAIILSHANIVRYYGVETMVNRNVHGQEEEVQIGVMEFVQEGQMKTFLAANPVSFGELNKLFVDILEGLKYLHAQGIIHRDIKPQNILLGRDKQNKLIAKISDFGISKSADSNQASASVLLGTIEYMAPEQFNPEKYGINKNISYNVDIWAFGVTAYYLLKGELLFGNRTGDTSAAHLINKIVSVEGLDERLDSVQEPYRSLLKKCIVPDANQRTSNLDELIAIMKPYVDMTASGRITYKPETSGGDETVAIQPMGGSSDETRVIERPVQTTKKPAAPKSPPPPPKPNPQSSAAKPKNKMVLIGAGVGLLIIAAVVLFATGVFSGESPEDIAARKEEERKAFLLNYIGKEMVQIPGGSFVFGGNPRTEPQTEDAKNPEQSMSLEKFSISKTEVTRYQWNTLMGDKKYSDALTPDAPGANLPANHVTWNDARDFSDAMNMLLAKHGDGGLKHFGLPTQVQWEYACMLEYPTDVNLDEVSWNAQNSGGSVHPVATKKPGKRGTYDMLGNVFEWCEELISLKLEDKPVSARIIRGGDFKNEVNLLDPKMKNVDYETSHNDIIGFRLILNER